MREVWEVQQLADPTARDRRHLHEVRLADHPLPTEPLERRAYPHPDQHHRQRCRKLRLRQSLAPRPRNQERDRNEPDQRRAQMQIIDRIEQRGEGVRAVGLLEAHLAFGVGVVPEHVGDLLEDQDHPDRRQQALDHAGRHEGRQRSAAREPEAELHHAGEHDREQERLVRTQRGDLGEHHGRETCGGTTDAGVRSTERADDDAADDPADDAGEQRRAGGQRDAEAQRKCHEEHDQRCDEVLTDVGEERGGRLDGC